MNTLSLTLLGAIAVTITSLVFNGNTNVVFAEPSSPSQLLVTQPASIGQPYTPIRQGRRSPYTREKLNAIVGSISTKPNRASQSSLLPAGLIPQSIMEVNKPLTSRSSDPLDLFKVPPLDSGLKVPINR